MPYSPPAYNAVDFNAAPDAYTAPGSTVVNFDAIQGDLTLPTAVITFAGVAPSIIRFKSVDLPSASITFAGVVPAVTGGRSYLLPVASIVFAGVAPDSILSSPGVAPFILKSHRTLVGGPSLEGRQGRSHRMIGGGIMREGGGGAHRSVLGGIAKEGGFPGGQQYHNIVLPSLHGAKINFSGVSPSISQIIRPLTLVDFVIVGGAGNVTSAAINTTGANFLYVVVSAAEIGTGTKIVSDSYANTWTNRTITSSTGGMWLRVSDVLSSPTVGPGHTFTFTSAAFPLLMVAAFFVPGGATFDQEIGATGGTSNTDRDSGTFVVPSRALCLSGFAWDVDGIVAQCTNGFTLIDQKDWNDAPGNEGGAFSWNTAAALSSPHTLWSATVTQALADNAANLTSYTY